jgi:hypothetical protein
MMVDKLESKSEALRKIAQYSQQGEQIDKFLIKSEPVMQNIIKEFKKKKMGGIF